MIETVEPAGIEENTAIPSALHLFRYKGPELERLRVRAAGTLQLEQSIVNTNNSLHNLNEEGRNRSTRLSQTAREFEQQLGADTSTATYGAAYLKMRDELPNIPPEDFMDFFNLCLTINTDLTERCTALAERGGLQTPVLKLIASLNANQLPLYHKEILDQMVHNPPGWFEGNATSWKNFVASYSNLHVYLNSDIAQSIAVHGPNQRISKVREYSFGGKAKFATTFRGNFPDWFLEKNDVVPEKEVVEKELLEDREQITLINDGLRGIQAQCVYLTDNVAEKTKRASDRLANQAKEVFPDLKYFSDLILFGKIADRDAPNIGIRRDLLDTAIKSYLDPDNILTHQEPIALFIERKLKEGKMMQNAQDPIDSRFISLFLTAFKNIKVQQKDGSKTTEFEALRTTDEKAFGALNYGLEPFLEILPIEEISLLEDLLAESEGKPIELFIWDLAGTLSSNFKEKGLKPKPGSLHYIQRFTTSFLKNHSVWAYNELQESLAGNDQKTTDSEPYEQPTAEVQQEIEAAREEIAQGNLAGWQIFYTDNRSLDQHHFKDVGGQTLEEREEALQKLLSKEWHLPSIKLGSIIRAFDWLVTVPEEVEQVRIKKDVGGETFRKLKRAGLRIFYNMDHQNKKLVFFLHQKQGWSYGFQ